MLAAGVPVPPLAPGVWATATPLGMQHAAESASSSPRPRMVNCVFKHAFLGFCAYGVSCRARAAWAALRLDHQLIRPDRQVAAVGPPSACPVGSRSSAKPNRTIAEDRGRDGRKCDLRHTRCPLQQVSQRGTVACRPRAAGQKVGQTGRALIRWRPSVEALHRAERAPHALVTNARKSHP